MWKQTIFLSNRKFRNHFEHYDERIEEWFENCSNGVYIDLAMNPSLSGDFGGNNNRGYNSFDNSLIFRGERLDLNQLINALQKFIIVVSYMCWMYLELPPTKGLPQGWRTE